MDKEVLLSHKKNEIMPFAATWINLEIITLSELSHTKKDKYGITYMCNLKYDTNELIYKTFTDSENNLMDTKGESGKIN